MERLPTPLTTSYLREIARQNEERHISEVDGVMEINKKRKKPFLGFGGDPVLPTPSKDKFPVLDALYLDKASLLDESDFVMNNQSILPGGGLPQVFATFESFAGTMNSHERGMLENDRMLLSAMKDLDKARKALESLEPSIPHAGSFDGTNDTYLRCRNNLSMALRRVNQLTGVKDADMEGRYASGKRG